MSAIPNIHLMSLEEKRKARPGHYLDPKPEEDKKKGRTKKNE